jgi:hypothetical protein
MGWSSYSDMVNELTTNLKKRDAAFQKIWAGGATGVAQRWYEFYTGTGNPGAGVLTGTAGTATLIKQSVQGAGLDVGGNVSADTKHLLRAAAFSPASTMVPFTAYLCDFLEYWPSMVVTGTPTTPGTLALTRYTDGKGVMVVVAVQSALGATQPALTLTCTYDDASSSAGGVLTAPGASAPTTTLFLNNGSPFMPLPAGKLGVKAITSYTLATGTTGTVAFFLVKPILSISGATQNVQAESKLLMELPQIIDDAHLSWIVMPGGALATSSLLGGGVSVGWG